MSTFKFYERERKLTTMIRFILLGCFVLAMVSTPLAIASDEAAIRAAVAKSLPLLERSSMTAIEERSNCFTCHHTGLPVMTLLAARERGFAINEDNLKTQLEFTASFLAKNRENYLKGKGQGGAALTAGSALMTLELGAWKRDATTDAVIEYLIMYQKDLGHWKPSSIRPPSEGSLFGATFAALEGLKAYGTEEQAGRFKERSDKVRSWLLATPAATTEDLVFRLRSLAVAEAGREPVQQAAQDLLRKQRKDGGWAQLDEMTSDAYATGTALVALHRAGGVAANDPAYQRGLTWLLQAQLPDGSWHVRTRSKPIQTYFESGYPHEKDQFISITAACWATTALVLDLPVSQ
jgi:squalene cyclase